MADHDHSYKALFSHATPGGCPRIESLLRKSGLDHIEMLTSRHVVQPLAESIIPMLGMMQYSACTMYQQLAQIAVTPFFASSSHRVSPVVVDRCHGLQQARTHRLNPGSASPWQSVGSPIPRDDGFSFLRTIAE